MLTRKRWTPPNYTGDARTDYQNLTKSISDYLLSLEAKGSLTIDEASIRAPQGIKFPSPQITIADANTLDDYVEGTWTPSVGGTATYTTQTGMYTKVGRLVHLDGHLVINAIGTGSTGIISNLPFSSSSIQSGVVGYYAGSATNFTWLGGYVTGNTFRLTSLAAAAAVVTDPAVYFQNGSNIYFSATFTI